MASFEPSLAKNGRRPRSRPEQFLKWQNVNNKKLDSNWNVVFKSAILPSIALSKASARVSSVGKFCAILIHDLI